MFYIGFSKPNKCKIGAEFIKLWINAPYSHAYVRFESSNSKIPSSVYQASHGMVHFISFCNFKKENIVIKEYKLDITAEQRSIILAHCMNLSGEPYGTGELLKIFVTDILHLFGIKIKTYNGRGYICSELVASILLLIYPEKQFKKPIYLINPKDVEEFLNG